MTIGVEQRWNEGVRSGHLPINGLNLYYEVYGEVGRSEASVAADSGCVHGHQLDDVVGERLLRQRAVIVFDQQGHGRTPDTTREMSYEQFADDAAAFLRALQVERAEVMGYSQGGGVALQLAIRHPSLVTSWSACLPPIARTAGTRRCSRRIEGLSADAFAGTPVENAFIEHTPDAAAFDAYLEKMKVLNIDDQNISDEEMRSISAKTMVIVGDADGVKPEHALAMFKLRGGGDEEAAASGMLQQGSGRALGGSPCDVARRHLRGVSCWCRWSVRFSMTCHRRRRISSEHDHSWAASWRTRMLNKGEHNAQN